MLLAIYTSHWAAAIARIDRWPHPQCIGCASYFICGSDDSTASEPGAWMCSMSRDSCSFLPRLRHVVQMQFSHRWVTTLGTSSEVNVHEVSKSTRSLFLFGGWAKYYCVGMNYNLLADSISPHLERRILANRYCSYHPGRHEGWLTSALSHPIISPKDTWWQRQ